MQPHSQPSAWIESLSWLSLSVAFASALIIATDIFGRGYRQQMPIMNLVYPVTALYWGPAALWFYFRHGRRRAKPVVQRRDKPETGRTSVVFQYFTIVPMRDVHGLRGVWAAVKADTLSILAFQAGLFAGVAIYQKLIWSPPLDKATATYWMLMQAAMALGFFTAWPVNSWLIRKGWKEAM